MPYDIEVQFHDDLPRAEATAVDVHNIEALLTRAMTEESVAEGTAVTVLFAGDDFLQSLNLEHRGVDEPTDVLSFAGDAPDEDDEAAAGDAFPGVFPDLDEEPKYLGDIAISVPTALRQAAEAGLEPSEEIGHLVVHGLLHILGWDHEAPEEDARMRAREESYLSPRIHERSQHTLH